MHTSSADSEQQNVCIGSYEDDLIVDGELQNEWICCTNWMHLDCVIMEGNIYVYVFFAML